MNATDGQARFPQSFQATRWTWIQLATTLNGEEALAALDALLCQYLVPIRKHIRCKFGVSEEDAADLQQSFVERRILQGQVLHRADRRVGKFRTFLLKALDRFVYDELAKAAASKRRPPCGFVSLEAIDGPHDLAAPEPGPSELDREWARSVIAQAIELTREFYAAKGNPRIWALFQEAELASSGERPRLTELARKHGFESSQQASNALVTVRRKLGTALREVIHRYTGTDAAIDEEIRALLAIQAESDASGRSTFDRVCRGPRETP